MSVDLQTPPKKNASRASTTLSKCRWWLRECIAGLFWLFLFAKVFIYDLDAILIEKLGPFSADIYKYRFFVFLAILAILWLTLGNNRFFSTVGYILGYPLVVLLWKIPKLCIKRWEILVAFSPAILASIKSFKRSFVFNVVAAIAILSICISQNTFLLITAMTVLGAHLFAHFVHRFATAFKPASVFADLANILRKTWNGVEAKVVTNAVKDTRDLDQNSPEYKAKKTAHLYNLYVYSVLFESIALKLKDATINRSLDAYLVMALASTMVRTVITFTFLYYALQKLDSNSFKLAEGAIWFCEVLTN